MVTVVVVHDPTTTETGSGVLAGKPTVEVNVRVSVAHDTRVPDPHEEIFR